MVSPLTRHGTTRADQGWDRRLPGRRVPGRPEGQELTYSVLSSDYGVARAWKPSASTLNLLAAGEGTATDGTVTAEDPDGNTVIDSFPVTVPDAAGKVAAGRGPPTRQRHRTGRLRQRWSLP